MSGPNRKGRERDAGRGGLRRAAFFLALPLCLELPALFRFLDRLAVYLAQSLTR